MGENEGWGFQKLTSHKDEIIIFWPFLLILD